MSNRFRNFEGKDQDTDFAIAEEMIDNAEVHNSVGMILRMYSDKWGNSGANELVRACCTKENWGIGEANE